MLFELLHAPFPEGYGEAILSLEVCKKHLRVDGDYEDDLIAALRDAAIDFVERYCSIKLGSTSGIVWTASGFPAQASAAIALSLSPVTAITTVSWLDKAGSPVTGDPTNWRVTAAGEVKPAIGGSWPYGVAGDVSIEFTAGFAPGAAPPALLAAAKMFLGHLYKNREAVTDRGTEAEVPFGVQALCNQHRRVSI